MTRRWSALQAACACAFLLLSASTGCAETAAQEAVVKWARENAAALNSVSSEVGMEDLDCLREVVGDARVVLLGDSRHDAREQWQLKRRMIEYLVKEMGFTVLGLEESLATAFPLDDYLMGRRDDGEIAQSEIGSWYIWDTEEMRGLMRALRSHNDTSSDLKRVHLYGFDVSDGSVQAVESALNLLARVDPETAERLRERIDLAPLDVVFWMQSMQNYSSMTSGARDSLGSGLGALVDALSNRRDELVDVSGLSKYEWALQGAKSAVRAHELMNLGASGSFVDGGNVREAAMVDNILWLLNTIAPGEKAVFWSHNFHSAKTPQDLNIPGRPPAEGMRPLGYLLAQELDEPIVSIGFSFERGAADAGHPPAPVGSVDNMLAQLGPDVLLLDLRRAPSEGPVHDWLNSRQAMRGQGGTSMLVPAKAFDALAFVREVGMTHPSELSSERLRAMGMQ